MCLGLLPTASFLSILQQFDADIASETQAKRCPYCGGRLHAAHYRRKPRGILAALPPELEETFCWRFSFCCDRDGCRKRVTPSSVRFLGRKVYVGFIIVVVTAMQQGFAPWRISYLRRLLGVSYQTMQRWRTFWQTHVPKSSFWRTLRAHFATPPQAHELPLALLEAYHWLSQCPFKALLNLLSLCLPLTTASGDRNVTFFEGHP